MLVTCKNGSICCVCGFHNPQEMPKDADCPRCGPCDLTDESHVDRLVTALHDGADTLLSWALGNAKKPSTGGNAKALYLKLAQFCGGVLVLIELLENGGDEDDEDDEDGENGV